MIRILHVDDDATESRLIKTILTRSGNDYEIEWTDTAAKAMELVKGGTFDCVLSDFQMPKMNGLDLLISIRADSNDMPFIFLTGHGNEKTAVEAFRAGADDYFTKSGDFAHHERLISSVKRVIASRREREMHRKTMSQLLVSNKKLSAAFNAIPDMVVITNLENDQIQDVNPGFERITGFNKDEVIGKTSHSIGLIEDTGQRESLKKELLAKKGSFHNVSMQFCRKSGESFPGHLSFSVFEQDDVPYSVAFIRDLTETI